MVTLKRWSEGWEGRIERLLINVNYSRRTANWNSRSFFGYDMGDARSTGLLFLSLSPSSGLCVTVLAFSYSTSVFLKIWKI